MPPKRKRFVGLDIHKDVVEYCILDAAGKKIDGGRIVCEHSVLKRFATTTLTSSDHVALEATTNTWSVVDILEPHVKKIVVGNPLKTKAIAEAKVKTDKIDALILAQLLRCDFLPSVWIPDKETRVLRRLSSFRKSLVQEATSTKNRIKGVLNHLLIKHDVSWTESGLEDLKKLQLPSHERVIMDCEIAMLKKFQEEIEKVEFEIKKLAYQEDNVRILMTLPGVDYNTATAVIAAFGDISRFKDADHAASYLGLVPRTKKSADTCHHGPITKTGASLARSMLCEAAQHLSRNTGPLGVFVRRMLEKKPWNKAIVAGAHKLATIAYHMLKNKEPYRYAAVQRTREKLSRLRTSVSETKFEYQRYRYDETLKREIPDGDVAVRFIPPLSDVYVQEGLPAARSFDSLSAGEKRVLKEMNLTEQIRQLEKVQVIIKPKKIVSATGKCTCNGTCVCVDCRCRECPARGDCANCPATDCPIRKPVPSGWQLAKTAEAAEFIDGPLAATVGELCIFRLNDTQTKADWAIIPAAPLYVDSGKNSVCFSTNIAARYTLIAAIVEDGIPKILLHVCDYGGVTPNPTPGPSPTPQPIPANLTDWVRQNRPEVGDTALSAVASCYRAAAEGIQKGLFASQEAAFAALRTATQTKIKTELWSGFFDQLEPRIITKLAGSTDVKKLGEIFTEVAAGLAGSPSETEELLFDAPPIPKAFLPNTDSRRHP